MERPPPPLGSRLEIYRQKQNAEPAAPAAPAEPAPAEPAPAGAASSKTFNAIAAQRTNSREAAAKLYELTANARSSPPLFPTRVSARGPVDGQIPPFWSEEAHPHSGEICGACCAPGKKLWHFQAATDLHVRRLWRCDTCVYSTAGYIAVQAYLKQHAT